MEALAHFDLQRPATLAEAAALAGAEGARLVAGGTDILVNIRRGIEAPGTLIDLSAIAEMKGVRQDGDDLVIGAGTTLAALIRDPLIKAQAPAVAQAAATIAGPTHREAATVGGNLCLDTRCVYYNQSEWWRKANNYCLKERGDTCHVAPTGKRCYAAFSGDLAPSLLVLGGKAEVLGPSGTRSLDLAGIYRDDGADHLTLTPGEILTSVRISPKGLCMAYEKVRVRAAIDFPLAGVAVALGKSGNTIATLRVGLTGVGSMPYLIDDPEAFAGATLDDAFFKDLDKRINKLIQPMRSTFTPSHYRRKVATNVVRRVVGDLFAG